ncbi:hypothetical protein [Comamonas testosteroni]|jgi:hypothetical protein|uniref:hypothetical protein n=1 Tax=Comamonas testosteroni TaxID=285 RepID=UPI0026E9A374|nr:hypothetical protein [Comamonas testosteroni]
MTLHDTKIAEALATAAANGHSEDDCFATCTILCPYCATVQCDDDLRECVEGLECDTCGGKFDLKVDMIPSYTTTKVNQKSPMNKA